MRHISSLLGATGLVLLCGSASWATPVFRVDVGPGNSNVATRTCSPFSGTLEDSSPVSASTTCIKFNDNIGVGNASASASFGDVGARSDAASISNTALVAGSSSQAVFSDTLIFTSNDDNATMTDVAVNLLLDGILNAAAPNGAAGAEIAGSIQLFSSRFAFDFVFNSIGVFTVRSNDFGMTSGVIGPSLNASLRSPVVSVPLGAPVSFLMVLASSAQSAGTFGSALSDFGGSLKFPSGADVFTVEDGVTANAGDYLVNNRFIDLNAPSIPEPSSFALMIFGMGLLVAGITRRRKEAFR